MIGPPKCVFIDCIYPRASCCVDSLIHRELHTSRVHSFCGIFVSSRKVDCIDVGEIQAFNNIIRVTSTGVERIRFRLQTPLDSIVAGFFFLSLSHLSVY